MRFFIARSGWTLAMGCSFALAACTDAAPEPPPRATAVDIALNRVDPPELVPGSLMVVSGGSFVPGFGGPSRLRLRGQLDGAAVDVRLPAEFVDYDRLEVHWPGGLAAGMPADVGSFVGEATVEAESALDGLNHRSIAVPLGLEVYTELTPRLDVLENETLFVNDPIVAHGDGFLLGGDEGTTFAIVEGCFTEEGASECTPVGPTEVAAQPVAPFERTRVTFPFSPHIAGIRPGTFSGSMLLLNRHASGIEHESASQATSNDIVAPAIFSLSPESASLGQYVDVVGGGFVGVRPGESDPTSSVTVIELEGTFTPESGAAEPANLGLVPEFVDGRLVRYVVNEEDELGQSIDVRKTVGTFTGVARPVVQFGADTVIGSDTNVSVSIAPLKQVVWLRFLPLYVESLRHFGLRALEERIRERVLEVVARDYLGVNIAFVTERPVDYALFSEVEIAGPDPNGIGLLGYDNTPGKDNGNLRLHDKIGGVNALTQLDGYPGFGGVFVESLFSFSQHPGALAQDIGAAHPLFDQLFDPFRPDRQGTPVAASELAGVPQLSDGLGCPAGDRATRIACAVWALGSLIGTTVSHEVAHSLGLADPGGEAFHNSGDWPNEIMDAGGARNFPERAEVGDGPGIFCRRNYDYLRQVLPTKDADPHPTRLDCY
jgi:hypothetical protein